MKKIAIFAFQGELMCFAHARKMGTLESAIDQDLPLCSGMSGHPSMSGYINEGYSIIAI